MARGLMPLYHPRSRGVDAALDSARRQVACYSKVEILNPTMAAIADFSTDPLDPGLPNSWLSRRPTDPGSGSGLSIQDANLLKIRVTFGQEMIVPFAKTAIAAAVLLARGDRLDAAERAWLQGERLPLAVSAMVRMHSKALPPLAAVAPASGCG